MMNETGWNYFQVDSNLKKVGCLGVMRGRRALEALKVRVGGVVWLRLAPICSAAEGIEPS